MALKWFRDEFFAAEAVAAQQAGLDAYDLMTAAAGRVPPGCDGLTVLPHLEGAFTPEYNPRRAPFSSARRCATAGVTSSGGSWNRSRTC